MDSELRIPILPAFRSRAKANGFTLTELVVALAVASILIAMAAPSFTGMLANQRIKGAATDLYISLTQARGEALKRNTSVVLDPVTANQWQDGWGIYFTDPTTGVKSKIYDHGPIKNITFSGPSVTYRSSGRVLATSTPIFTISEPAVTNTKICVLIDLSGRPYQKTMTTSSPCS